MKRLKCILLIDDDEPTNFLYRIVIETANCTDHIEIAQNGFEAFKYLAKSIKDSVTYPYPELIFLDINMPGMDGWEFIERYHALQQHNVKSPVIMMLSTSLNPDDELRAAHTSGIAGFLNKPLAVDQVREIIDRRF